MLDHLTSPSRLKTNSPLGILQTVQTWLGISRDDLWGVFAGWLGSKQQIEQQFLAWTERNPLDAALEFLLASSWLFFLAEKETNPKVHTFIDAFYYIATCASVGYADIYAATQTGRAVASLVMIVGPALTNRALERQSSIPRANLHSDPPVPLNPGQP